MGQNTVHQIHELAENVERLAGMEVRQKVMEGSDKITASTKPEKVAAWVQGAMERLEALVGEPTRSQILVNCGHNCARANRAPLERAKARRKEFQTLDEFLQAELDKPPAGMRFQREGDTLYHYYTPRAFTHPMRCYCSLLRGLPAEETVSLTYCQCSRGFVEEYWEAVLGRPVRVEVLESCVAGAEECKFAVHL